MSRLIINVYRGIVDGVYTDTLEDMEVKICDVDDGYDDERSAQFAALQHQVKYGGLRNLVGLPDQSTQCTRTFNPDALLLIRESNIAQSEVGKTAQRLSAAFVDGYLSAHAELSRYLMRLYREKVVDAAATHRMLSPLLDQQNLKYDELCEDLNRPELFDESTAEN